jgi:hypothetical protein
MPSSHERTRGESAFVDLAGTGMSFSDLRVEAVGEFVELHPARKAASA